MSDPVALRRDAEGVASTLPPLLAEADRLAATVQTGVHGRRRAGMGDEFWQYRQAVEGDDLRQVDWRRSGRSDVHFIRQREWQAQQKVLFWVDPGQSMQFSATPDGVTKRDRAALLALAASILLVRGGEQVGLINSPVPPGNGRGRLRQLAVELAEIDPADYPDFAAPDVSGVSAQVRLVILSDFLGPLAPINDLLSRATAYGVRGTLMQILDPQEVAFPFRGRSIFETPGKSLRYETLRASGLRDRYLERLTARQDALRDMARHGAWQFGVHSTDRGAGQGLMWLYRALEDVR